MSGPLDFTNQNIENTYQRVLQTDGIDVYDGTGSLFVLPSANTSSLLTTASATGNTITFTKGDTSQFTITVDTGSGTNIDTGSFVTTSSFNNFTSSYNTGSFTGSFTGIFNGTASWASSASQAISASYALNGGVTQILAGSNISISPTTGLGQVTISSTGGGGGFNTATGSYGSFYDTTTQTNPVGNVPRSMSFNTTDISNGVSISGSTNPFNTYIKTENAGVYDIQFSAQLDKTDGGADEIVIWLRKNGIDLTDTATTITLTSSTRKQVAAWNFFVNSAANDYYQLIWYSPDTAVRLLAEVAGGGHPGIPSVILTVNRVDQFLSNTGSFTGSFTGELIGTASWATNALTASFVTASNVYGPFGSNSILSASYASQSLSSSYSDTASYALNGLPPGTSGQILQIDLSNQYQLQTTINDSSGNSSVNFESRVLGDSTSTDSIDYANRVLYDINGNSSIEYDNRLLYDSSTAQSIDYSNRLLYWPDGTTIAIDFDRRGKIYDNTGIEAISFLDGNSRFLYDKSGTASLDYDNRFLLSPDGTTPTLAWTANTINITGSTIITGSLTVSGSSTFTNIGPAVFSGSVSISGSTQGGGSGHILTYNTASGEIFFTASSAIGGGGGGSGITQLTGDVTAGPGSGTQTATLKSNLKSGSFGVTIDGNGGVIAVGQRGYVTMPYDGTILDWRLVGDVAGSCNIDVRKSTFASFPTQTSITGSAPITMSAAQKASSSILTDWTSSFNQGDVFGFTVVSATSITRLYLSLTTLKS